MQTSKSKGKRISFNEYDASHLYEFTSQNFQKGCMICKKIKLRLETFIGEKEVKRIKRIIKKHPY